MIVTVYTVPTCPKCKVLKKKLSDSGIEYKEINDVEEMKKMGIKAVPYLDVNGELLDFSGAIAWIRGGAH